MTIPFLRTLLFLENFEIKQQSESQSFMFIKFSKLIFKFSKISKRHAFLNGMYEPQYIKNKILRIFYNSLWHHKK